MSIQELYQKEPCQSSIFLPNEVYVRPFSFGSAAAAGSKWQISTGGGEIPAWRRDGKELFFRAADRNLMAVPVTSGAMFQAGAPQPLFELAGPADFPFSVYDVRADGHQFLVSTPLGDASSPVNVCLNWLAGVSK